MEDFKEKEPGWKFKMTIEGYSYWDNEVEEHTTAKFPGLEQVKHRIKLERNKIAKIVQKHKN